MNFFWSYNNVTGFTPVKFGLLYNWYMIDDARGIAPSGWHVPTIADGSALMLYLDPDGANNNNDAGTYLKEQGTTHWISDSGVSNSTGFTARGAGWRSDVNGGFQYLNNIGYIQYADLLGGNARHGKLQYDNNIFNTYYYGGEYHGKSAGMPCRYMKNDSTWSEGDIVTDYDGNVYETVKIGNQVWTKSNIIVKHYNNGDEIANVTDNTTWAALTSGAWCYYNNDPSNQ